MMQHKFSQKMSFFILAIAALFFTLLLSYTVFSPYFEVTFPTTTIKIEATASKSSFSWGTDVRIVEVKVDDVPIPWNDFKKNGEWTNSDSLLIAINPVAPASIEYSAPNAESLKITFSKNDGSGIVKITVNGRKISQNNLYSPTFEDFTVSKSLKSVSVFSHAGLFLCIFAVLFGLNVFLFACLLPSIQSYPDLIKICRNVGHLYLIFLAVIFLFRAISVGIGIGFFLYLAVIAVFSLCKICSSDSVKKAALQILFNLFALVSTSFIAVYITEGINGNIGNLSSVYLIGNSGIYLVILLLLQILLRSVVVSAAVGSLIAFLYGTANYFVTLFRGSPIVPGDFFAAGTAKNVALNYSYRITPELVLALLLLLVWIYAVWRTAAHRQRLKWRYALAEVIPAAALAWFISTSDFYLPNLDLWNLNNNTKEYGLAMSLVSNIRKLNIAEPEGYSVENLTALCQQYAADEDSHYIAPNIIAIMNESYSDLSLLDSDLDNSQYMAYYNSLQNNTVKGHMLVSTIGGGTANTEYEFLTGNSLAFIPGTVPYQQFVLKDAFSLAGLLKARNYTTLAVHPYDGSGYNRESVYSHFGFDQFIDIDSFINPELTRDRYVSDQASYKKVIELFQEYASENQPVFIFNVTMQNHSGYSTGFYGDNTIKIPGHEGKFPDAEEYLTLIKESDNAIPLLIDYFSTVDEPTVIIMFGDHQPKIDDAFYETALGKPLKDWSLDETQKRFIVPFFIWANYDIPEADNVFTSANYLSSLLFQSAGIKPVPYQNYLLEQMQKIPAMNANGYYSADGSCFTYSEENEFSSILKTYWDIQYNNMFDSDKCPKWFTEAGQ